MMKKSEKEEELRRKAKEGFPAWKIRLYEIIYEAETPAGRAFDVILLALIIGSVLAVILESVASLQAQYGTFYRTAEWIFTIIFTLEYGLRILVARHPWRFITSFFGIVDLISIIPTYLSLGIEGAQSLLVIRSLRLLRVFRVLKLARFSIEAETLWIAIKGSRHKIFVFVGTVFTIAIIMGTLMYVVEGSASGIHDIPTGIYWAITTVSTVGFGDIVPHTAFGKFITSVLMIMGYGLIAVPTGIVSVELAHATQLAVNTITCPACSREGHDLDALHCRFCGEKLKL